MSEKVYTVRYEVEGIHEQVMATKSLIYALNAVRLSIKDIDMMMRGPTIQNVMWTAIQLTRTYTHLRRIIRMVSKEQDIVLAKSLAIRATTAGMPYGQTRFGPGGALMVPAITQGAWATLAGVAAAHPVGTIVVGGVIIGGGLFAGWYLQQEQAKKAYRERMREIAKTQGLEE